MLLQSAKLRLTRGRSSVTHVEKKAIRAQIVPGLTRHRSLAMVVTENLATMIETGTLRNKTHSHVISLAKVRIGSHTTERGTTQKMIAIGENLVIMTDHTREMMIVGDLAAIFREVIIVFSAGNLDIGNMSVQKVQK